MKTRREEETQSDRFPEVPIENFLLASVLYPEYALDLLPLRSQTSRIGIKPSWGPFSIYCSLNKGRRINIRQCCVEKVEFQVGDPAYASLIGIMILIQVTTLLEPTRKSFRLFNPKRGNRMWGKDTSKFIRFI